METPIWGSSITREQLMRSISLLRLEDEVPGLPSEHDTKSGAASSHCMEISREKEIASHLAFISAIKWSKFDVMGVCIEENTNGRECTIRLASNTGDKGILPEVVSGFKEIAGILEQASRRENTKLEDQNCLFKQIVRIDISRILTRLRSKHAPRSRKTQGKKPRLVQLREQCQDDLLDATSRNKINILHGLFERLEAVSVFDERREDAEGVIGEIVKEAHELTRLVDITVAFGSTIDPTLKETLPDAIKKLGRYYSIAFELIRAARDRETQIFEKVHIEEYQIQVPKFVEMEIQASQNLEFIDNLEMIPRERANQWKQKLRNRIQHVAGKRFVHAEVQLLLYYEMSPATLHPRFIASSKKACFLCDLFFQIHQGFHVPRAHGRLYDKWILPDWLAIPPIRQRELAMITERLRTALDGKVKDLVISKPKGYFHPNESFLPPDAHWSQRSSVVTGTALTSIPSSRARSPLVHGERAAHTISSRVHLPSPALHRQLDASKEDVPASEADMPQASSSRHSPISQVASFIKVRKKDLPYTHIVTVTTPSLYLRVGEETVTFEFVRVFSGRLSISHVGEVDRGSLKPKMIRIEDIPETSELQVACLPDSNEFKIQLQGREIGPLIISFVWSGATDG